MKEQTSTQNKVKREKRAVTADHIRTQEISVTIQRRDQCSRKKSGKVVEEDSKDLLEKVLGISSRISLGGETK